MTRGGPVSAVAYSPEIRIGVAARLALSRGGAASPAGLPEAVRERVLYIAMRSYPHNPDPGVSLDAPESRVYITFKAVVPTPQSVEALWVSHDPESVLRTFGAVLPYRDIALIAAFPIFAVVPQSFVVGVRQDPSDRQRFHTWVAEITREDVAALRR